MRMQDLLRQDPAARPGEQGGLKPNDDGGIVTAGQVVRQLASTFMKAE